MSFICSDASIAGYATTYLRLFFLLELVPLFIYNAVCGFTEADGNPQVVTRAVIIAGIVNVVLDLLFVGVFHWGISGALYGTVINDLIVVAILCRHLYQHSSLRCHMPSKGFLSISREIFAEGIPLTVGDTALMSGFMVLNSAIIYKLGSSSMFIWSVCMEIFDFVMIALSGVETSMVSIGGFLTGDEDVTGLRMMVRRILSGLTHLLTVSVAYWCDECHACGVPIAGISFCQRGSLHQSDVFYRSYHLSIYLLLSLYSMVGLPHLECADASHDVCLHAVLPPS